MRHGTAGQESATNSGKAGSVKAKTTALALVSLPAGAVPTNNGTENARLPLRADEAFDPGAGSTQTLASYSYRNDFTEGK